MVYCFLVISGSFQTGLLLEVNLQESSVFKMSVLLIKIVLQMLVVFKSAPILKRVLKVKHELLQLYVLKVSLFTLPIHPKQITYFHRPFIADSVLFYKYPGSLSNDDGDPKDNA